MTDSSKVKDFDKRVETLSKSIASVPDFPKDGILFRDITTLLEDGNAFKESIDLLYEIYKDSGADCIVAADARGFIFGSVLAYKLGIGLVLVRKKGKLPRKTRAVDYNLEYGYSTLEICEDAIKEGQKVILIDDLLATGGTAKAMVELVNEAKAKIISFAFIIELFDLGGKKVLNDLGVDVLSLVKFPGH